MANSTDGCILTTFCVSKRYCILFSHPIMGLDGSYHSTAEPQEAVGGGGVTPKINTSLVEKGADINTQVR